MKIILKGVIALMGTILCACPYIDHGFSDAAEFVSEEEIQGCYYRVYDYYEWSEEDFRRTCSKVCFEDSIAVVSEKFRSFNKVTNEVSSKNKDSFIEPFSEKYKVVENYDQDGTLFYSISVPNFEKLIYRNNGTFEGTNHLSYKFTKEESSLCEF